MDVDHVEGIVEVDETYFLYSQKVQRGIKEQNLNLNLEESATNKYVFLPQETV